jgi:glycosyltransferase involved in cell wall biosynthesis
VQTISVVVPTLNRAELLARTIDHIQSQTVSRDRYEVIVVDNNSTDDTQLVLAEKADDYPNLRFACQRQPGAAAARNAGLQRAEGDLVLFIDDDIEADPELIERHLDFQSEHSDASVVGTIRTQWETTRIPFLRYLRDRRICNPYSLTNGKMDFSCYHTGNVSTPRDMLNAVGGFDERFAVYGMEDIELGYRLERIGSTMVPATDAVGTHSYCPTFSQFTERCEQAGFSLGLMVSLHPELRSRFTENTPLGRFLRPFHGVYRLSSPFLEPFIRTLTALETRQGSGPVSALLAFHYAWALRYHFFVGYSHYLEDGQSSLVALEGRRVEGLLQVEETPSKVESGSVVSS